MFSSSRNVFYDRNYSHPGFCVSLLPTCARVYGFNKKDVKPVSFAKPCVKFKATLAMTPKTAHRVPQNRRLSQALRAFRWNWIFWQRWYLRSMSFLVTHIERKLLRVDVQNFIRHQSVRSILFPQFLSALRKLGRIWTVHEKVWTCSFGNGHRQCQHVCECLLTFKRSFIFTNWN